MARGIVAFNYDGSTNDIGLVPSQICIMRLDNYAYRMKYDLKPRNPLGMCLFIFSAIQELEILDLISCSKEYGRFLNSAFQKYGFPTRVVLLYAGMKSLEKIIKKAQKYFPQRINCEMICNRKGFCKENRCAYKKCISVALKIDQDEKRFRKPGVMV